MEVHELHEVIKDRFDSLDKRLDRMDEKVTSHDRWLWFGKGMLAILSIAVGWLHFK